MLLPNDLCVEQTPILPAGADSVLKTLNGVAANLAYYRRKDYETQTAAADSRGGRGPSLDVSKERSAQRQRVRLICRDMYKAVADRPEEDQALAINELVETYMPRSVRLLLRAHTFVEREKYVAIRSTVYELREKYWTAENWLELRLCKYIATGVFRLGHKLFSMVQNNDGVWEVTGSRADAGEWKSSQAGPHVRSSSGAVAFPQHPCSCCFPKRSSQRSRLRHI